MIEEIKDLVIPIFQDGPDMIAQLEKSYQVMEAYIISCDRCGLWDETEREGILSRQKRRKEILDGLKRNPSRLKEEVERVVEEQVARLSK